MEKSHKAALLSALFCAFLLTSCGEGKYEVKGDGVYYTYWTFSFGNQEKELKGADAATFESVKDWLGRDHQHVWYKESLVEGAEPASVKVDDYPLFHDKRDYYFEGKPVHVADMASMRVIEISREEFWGADSRYIYFNNSRIEGGDPATLEQPSRVLLRQHHGRCRPGHLRVVRNVQRLLQRQELRMVLQRESGGCRCRNIQDKILSQD